MVEGFFQPLTIFIIGLGGGFLIPLLYRIARPLPVIAFALALACITVISGVLSWGLYNGGPVIDIYTAGGLPPFTINLRFGFWEGFCAFSVNIVSVLGAWHMRERLCASYPALLLYLILTTGINGLIMTRDLFNLFVFLEIVSIATYGLLGFEHSSATLAASFKYIVATVLASSFFLVGIALLYHVTGTLNIDDMIEHRMSIVGPIGATALLLVLSCFLIELKPFPANGWGIDVYETAPSGIAALIAGAVSAGVFFALFKLLPLFENHLGIIAVSGGITFLFSNLVGLKQTNVQRLLGYSSIAQMGLLTLALAIIHQLDVRESLPLVVGGLFINHLLAKAGLFWLAGAVRQEQVDGWTAIGGRPFILLIFAMLLVAIAGLPPFPGFWAKWELVTQIAVGKHYAWIAVILSGSLLEAVYMFRWFMQATRATHEETTVLLLPVEFFPVTACAALLAAGGYAAASISGAASIWLFLPLCAGVFLYLVDWLPNRFKCLLMLALVLLFGTWMIRDIQGLNKLFAVLLLAGELVVASAGLYRTDSRPGFYPLMAILLLSVAGLLRASTSLEFFFNWELITLSSFFLIARSHKAHPYALSFLLFSLASAFCLLAGFAIATAANGTMAVSAFASTGPDAWPAIVLLATGFLIKAGAAGVHVWLPGCYAEADDDLSAMLSAVVSKVAIFGIFTVTYLAIRSEMGLELAYVLGWIGLITTLVGALMALQQDDIKRMLAYSSMSQLGYIITAIALMSHLGWVTAFYLIANHLMVKGVLFLAVAGVILRTDRRLLDDNGGLAREMPFTFASVLVAIVSMSGLPPLAGFGGKWLLLSAMVEKGWYPLAAVAVVATFIGFLYMFHLVHAVFLGSRKTDHAAIGEAPPTLLIPQFVLIAGILILSFFPKLLMDPVSAAIDPTFAANLVWKGMSLETIYGYWNPIPVMGIAVVITAFLFALVWLYYRLARNRSAAAGIARFYAFYKVVLTPLATPFVYQFWDGVSALTVSAADSTRKIYTGNGRTYALCVLCYTIALYMIGTYGS